MSKLPISCLVRAIRPFGVCSCCDSLVQIGQHLQSSLEIDAGVGAADKIQRKASLERRLTLRCHA
jgi:hypothetical protein